MMEMWPNAKYNRQLKSEVKYISDTNEKVNTFTPLLVAVHKYTYYIIYI